MRLELAPGIGRATLDAWALEEGAQLVDILPARGERERRVVYALADGSLVALLEPADAARRLELSGHDPEGLAARIGARLATLPVGPEPSREALPERPRLRSSVHVRRHAESRDATSKVILHEWRSDLVLEIDEASLRALEAADGTRDLDALCLALARRGDYRGEADLVQLLEELGALGVLSDGLDVPAPAPPVSAPRTPLQRPLDVLEGFTLVCDGGGSCCRLYGSVAFAPRDVLRARLAAENMALPLEPERLFTPLAGAQREDDGACAVALVDGRCAFLEGDGRCGLHRRGGPRAKPAPCRLYPTMLMDDGTSVRVSLGPECACVFASLGRSDGAPLVPEGARTLADLGPDVRVMHVPDPVPLTASRTASRVELVDWSRALQPRLERADAVAFVWALADALRDGGLSLEGLERARAAPAPSAARVEPWLAALSAGAEATAESQERWRSDSDLSRRVARWMADALASARAEDLLVGAADAEAERFYVRALAHGHRLALDGRTLEHGLRDRATRMLAARAMARSSGLDDTSRRYPLALVEAAMRALGITGYADRS